MRAAGLSGAGLIGALVAAERLVAAVAAKQQEFLAELAHRDPRGDQYLRDEAACALKIAPATAAQRLDEAVQLTGRLGDTHELVAAGLLHRLVQALRRGGGGDLQRARRLITDRKSVV